MSITVNEIIIPKTNQDFNISNVASDITRLCTELPDMHYDNPEHRELAISNKEKIVAVVNHKIQNGNYHDFCECIHQFNPDMVLDSFLFPTVQEYDVNSELSRYTSEYSSKDKQHEYQMIVPFKSSGTFALKLPSDLGRYEVYRHEMLLGTSDECGYCYIKKDDYEFKDGEKSCLLYKYLVPIFGASEIEANRFNSVTIRFTERVKVQTVFSMASRKLISNKNITFNEKEQTMTINCMLSRRNMTLCSDNSCIYRYST
jgi:hypothetical protein